MAYGTIKIDTITFTDGGIDKSVAISGLVQNPTFTGNVTVTGTISGNTVRGQTVSGVTVTGTTAQFTSGTFVSLTGTTLQGTTATYTTGSFTSLTGTTTSGTTANFVSGVFSTQLSGVTVTGTTASFTSGNFTNISGGTHTITSGVFAAGTAANPSISFTSDPNTGIYSPGADQVAISTNGSRGLLINSDGVVSVGRPDSAGTGMEIGAGATGNRSVVIDLIGDTTYSDYGLRLIRESTGANATSALVHRGTGELYMVAVDSAPLVFSTVNQERMRLDSSGRLGLGTSSPTEQLSVAGGNVSLHTASSRSTERRLLRYDASSVNGMAAIGMNGTGTNGFLGEIKFYTSNSDFFDGTLATRMIVDSSGNVGIGTTSVGARLHIRDGSNINLYGAANGTAFQWTALNDAASAYIDYIQNAATLQFQTGGLERARIDSSGRLLVGTSSYSGDGTGFEIEGTGSFGPQIRATAKGSDVNPVYQIIRKARGTSIVQANDKIFTIGVQGYDGASYINAAAIDFEIDGTPGANDMPGRLVFSTTADGASSPTERMRITSGGDVLIGQSTNPATSRVVVQVQTGTANGVNAQITSDTGTSYPWSNYNASGTYVGGITCTSTATSFPTSSDYRLKQNVQPLVNATALIAQLKPSVFEFKEDTGTQVQGFIAHELQEVVPLAVIGEKDAVNANGNPIYQGVDAAKLVPLLTAALQETLQKIEDLEGRLIAAGL
jgi:hypothetical protein